MVGFSSWEKVEGRAKIVESESQKSRVKVESKSGQSAEKS